MSLIEALTHFSAPQQVAEDWIVQIATHYLGGGRHFGSWELADIGFIVVIRDLGVITVRKIALLQSKRLYPEGAEIDEDNALDYMIGFGRLMPDETWMFPAEAPRSFSFFGLIAIPPTY